MLKKERKDPLKLKAGEALLRKLLHPHPKRMDIEDDLKKIRAGFRGEKELDYHLHFLPEEDYYIFQGLHLPGFQLDAFVLCSRFGVIIECKNISGTLFFDSSSDQFIRTKDNLREGFADPLLQAKRQRTKLQKWILTHKLKPVPIYYLVAISFPSSIIETERSNYHIFRTVTHAERIPDRIARISDSHLEVILSPYHLKKWTDLLLSEDQPPAFDALQTYQLHPTDLIVGIPCPACRHTPMARGYGRWNCLRCKVDSQDAHIQPILDHLLLFQRLTNCDVQKLLRLPSPYTVSRLLTAMNLPYKGEKKGRIYFYPE